MLSELPKAITIREVGPRDGLQNEARPISTDDKVRLVDALTAAGLGSVQVTAMVHPKLVPQMADGEAVMARIDRSRGTSFAVLVPNLKGAERAAAVGADEWSIMLSASETHNRTNANAGLDEALARVAEVVRFGRERGAKLRGGMSMALGCTFEGRVPRERLVRLVEAYRALGVTEVGLADTAGLADPRHVYETARFFVETYPDVSFKLHLHNTRGMGLANALAGMAAGITVFDASIGGLGGCPFAPGATGNIATEELVHMCDEMGIATGVDLDALLEITAWLPEVVGHPLDSGVARAGPSRRLVAASAARVAAA